MAHEETAEDGEKGLRPGRASRIAPKFVSKIEYGWWVAIAGAISMTITNGPVQQASSALFTAIEGDFHWSRAAITGAASFGQLSMAVLGPIQGTLVDRFGAGRMILIGLTLGGIGAILLSQVHGLVMYYGAFLAMTTGIALGGFMPSMTAVNAWMPHRRAGAMAIIQLGNSMGALLVPAIALGITLFGWRDTVIGVGALILAATPVLARVIGRPAPLELTAAQLRRMPSRSRGEQGEFTAREALHTRAFWIIATTHTLANLSVAAVTAHLILHLTDVGLSLNTASTVLPIIGAAGFASQVTGGVIGDRVDKRLAVSFLLAVQASAVVVLAFSRAYWVAVIFGMVWGIGFGARAPLLHALRGEYFGRRSFGAILGMNSVPLSLGMMSAPVIVGWVYDAQGTYMWAFLALAGAAYAASALILTAKPPTKPGTPQGSTATTAPQSAAVLR